VASKTTVRISFVAETPQDHPPGGISGRNCRGAGQRHARAMDVSPELLEERWIPSDAFV
jgi:hypothetical protein